MESMWENWLTKVAAMVRQAVDHSEVKGRRGASVIAEGHHDVKIAADFRLEELLLEGLARIAPFPVLAEESGLSGIEKDLDDYHWIVDPLDGSLNYLRGIPLCCVSVALWRGKSPCFGVVYDFWRDELFTGVVGGQAELDGQPITVSATASPDKAILCTGFPVGMDFSDDVLSRYVADIQQFRKIRLLGSAALSLAYVACGRADIYKEKDIKIWDVAAGMALVLAAGGKVHMSRASAGKYALSLTASNNFLLGNQVHG